MAQIRDVIDAYDLKYEDGGFRNNESYYRWVLDALDTKPGQSLLDVACGLGDLLHYASQSGLRCSGVDLSPVALRQAKERAPTASVSVGNGQHLPFADESFDIVTLLGSLEHFLDPGTGLLEIRRVLRWGGRALVVVPNSYYLPDIVWNVWRTRFGPYHKQVVERFATAQEWRVFIELGGLKVRQITKFNFQRPRNREDWGWYKSRPTRLLGLLASPFIPFNLSHSFLYFCEKAPDTRGHTFRPPPWPAPPILIDDRHQ